MSPDQPLNPKAKRRRRRSGVTATLSDIARAAGVSTASVSRALARPELVSEWLRERVLQAVCEAGYVPNAAARGLSGSDTGVIGLVAGSLDDLLSRRAMQGFERHLAKANFGVMVAISNGDAVETLGLAHTLQSRGVDGLAFVGVDAAAEAGRLRDSRRPLPVACIDQPMRDADVTIFSRARALELATRFLRQLGHRRIALVLPGAIWHVDTVRDALSTTDISLLVAQLGLEHVGSNGMPETLSAWLELPLPPSAILCGSDALAAATLRQCELKGVAVPHDLSVVGFGDTELARVVRPSLSSLRIPAYEMGVAAAEFLLRSLRRRPQTPQEFSAKLVARESTAAASKREASN